MLSTRSAVTHCSLLLAADSQASLRAACRSTTAVSYSCTLLESTSTNSRGRIVPYVVCGREPIAHGRAGMSSAFPGRASRRAYRSNFGPPSGNKGRGHDCGKDLRPVESPGQWWPRVATSRASTFPGAGEPLTPALAGNRSRLRTAGVPRRLRLRIAALARLPLRALYNIEHAPTDHHQHVAPLLPPRPARRRQDVRDTKTGSQTGAAICVSRGQQPSPSSARATTGLQHPSCAHSATYSVGTRAPDRARCRSFCRPGRLLRHQMLSCDST